MGAHTQQVCYLHYTPIKQKINKTTPKQPNSNKHHLLALLYLKFASLVTGLYCLEVYTMEKKKKQTQKQQCQQVAYILISFCKITLCLQENIRQKINKFHYIFSIFFSLLQFEPSFEDRCCSCQLFRNLYCNTLCPLILPHCYTLHSDTKHLVGQQQLCSGNKKTLVEELTHHKEWTDEGTLNFISNSFCPCFLCMLPAEDNDN